jgi:hypothetical protein
MVALGHELSLAGAGQIGIVKFALNSIFPSAKRSFFDATGQKRNYSARIGLLEAGH